MQFVKSFLMGKAPAKGASEEVAQLPEGELYITRTNSAKGARECIYTMAVATVRRTEAPFEYQLVIQRAYEEGEAELLDEIDDDGDEDRTFLIEESLKPRIGTFENKTTFAWRDLDEADATGSSSDENLYEFMVDSRRIDGATVGAFYEALLRGIYENKYGKSSISVTLPELKEMFDAHSTTDINLVETHDLPEAVERLGDEFIVSEPAELYVWNSKDNGFIPIVAGAVDARIVQTGQYQYWIVAKSKGDTILAHEVNEEMNGQASAERASWTWNHTTKTGTVNAWAMRFPDAEALHRFIKILTKAYFEVQNAVDFEKIKAIDQDYVFTTMTEDVEMADASDEEAEVADVVNTDGNETPDEDESESEAEEQDWATNKNAKNNGLAVGYKGMSLVVRGDQIGVFKATQDGKMELGGTVNHIATPGKAGKRFEPNKVMFHDQDRKLILMNPTNHHSLYEMDLETGKVVEEWKVHEDIEVNAMAPVSKLAQMNPEQTIFGTSHNALFRIDPRVAGGNKLVQQTMKQYTTKNKFSSIATTEAGHIAVGSEKGEIRLFDTLGKIAKTNLPGIGDPIRGIDVTKDGRWLIATCKTYVLLIDTQIGTGKNVGNSGFTKSFPADAKPKAKKLQLKPEHVAFMGSQVNFSAAKFNVSPDTKETAIVTSSGSFVIAWNFDKVKKGKLDQYEIKRYTGPVVEDNFSFGNDKDIIVALQNDVLVLPKNTMQKASRLSQGAPRKSRSSIVNAPY